jgi:hypothetical protein
MKEFSVGSKFRQQSSPVPEQQSFIIGCDSLPTIHLLPVTAEPNAVACRVQTKFRRVIPDFEILQRLSGTGVP